MIMYPAMLSFAVIQQKRLLLIWKGERIQKWDIPSGICSREPDERYLEMSLKPILNNPLVEKVERVKGIGDSEFTETFVDSGIYRCILAPQIKIQSPYACFTDGKNLPLHTLTKEACVAIRLCL